jgi:hypothetical protein
MKLSDFLGICCHRITIFEKVKYQALGEGHLPLVRRGDILHSASGFVNYFHGRTAGTAGIAAVVCGGEWYRRNGERMSMTNDPGQRPCF